MLLRTEGKRVVKSDGAEDPRPRDPQRRRWRKTSFLPSQLTSIFSANTKQIPSILSIVFSLHVGRAYKPNSTYRLGVRTESLNPNKKRAKKEKTKENGFFFEGECTSIISPITSKMQFLSRVRFLFRSRKLCGKNVWTLTVSTEFQVKVNNIDIKSSEIFFFKRNLICTFNPAII